MEDLMNAVRREATMVQSETANTRLGTVTAFDPATYAVKVKLQPEEAETGYIPLASAWVGNGWGLYCPPADGDQVVVQFQEGDVDAGVCLGVLYNDEDRPRSDVARGEMWLVHASGAKIRLRNSGFIEILAGTVNIGSDGGAFRRLIDERLIALFNSHVHGNSGPPTPTLSLANTATTSLKGG